MSKSSKSKWVGEPDADEAAGGEDRLQITQTGVPVGTVVETFRETMTNSGITDSSSAPDGAGGEAGEALQITQTGGSRQAGWNRNNVWE